MKEIKEKAKEIRSEWNKSRMKERKRKWMNGRNGKRDFQLKSEKVFRNCLGGGQWYA